MSVWVRVDEALPYHYKIANMRKILGAASIIEPIGYVVMLWIYALKVAWRDGDLSAYEDMIEYNCLWKGEPGLLLKAFRGCGKNPGGDTPGGGFLDGCIVHDWVKTANKLIRDRIYREERDAADQGGEATSESVEVMEAWNAFAREHALAGVARAPALPAGFGAIRLKALLLEAAKQPFLLGKGPKGWKIDLPWLLRKPNADKVLVGAYVEHVAPAVAQAQDVQDDYRERTRKIMAARKAYKPE